MQPPGIVLQNANDFLLQPVSEQVEPIIQSVFVVQLYKKEILNMYNL